MTLGETIGAIANATTALKDLAWLVAFVWSVKKLSGAADKLIKNYPDMIKAYEDMRTRQRTIDLAAMRRGI